MPIAWRAASSASCSAGMYSREPTNACPRGMLYVALTKLTALATLPAQPTYCRLTPQVAVPVFSSPLSSSTNTASPSPVRCSTANARTVAIAASVSHDARSSSSCAADRSSARARTCRPGRTVPPGRSAHPTAPTARPVSPGPGQPLPWPQRPPRDISLSTQHRMITRWPCSHRLQHAASLAPQRSQHQRHEVRLPYYGPSANEPTPCSRPPSRRSDGSASTRAESATSSAELWFCSISNTTEPHEQLHTVADGYSERFQ